ncbi:WSC domain-containing protein [Chaetomidium leptoderma]|uniref:WSC domain-containing protein n=1 Tax=Chaetomidium leptoderma TaxID=669021 RepID=A0AAN6VVA5_9PEZI|nr:WSC domain-containing protein [Chaetomidium leptoderma]
MAALRTMAAAMAAVALVRHVQATEVPLPPCLDPFRPFVYSGCFQDSGNPQILPYRSPAPPDDMTVEKCMAECKGNGYRYAGLVYYGVCYCGSTVNGPEVEESQCNLPCKGNSSQTCGGDNIFSVYTDPTFPIEDVTVEDYDSLGCWTDDSSMGRALTYRQDKVDGATLTTEKCLLACRDGGFPFAGTEFGGECYCGVVIGNGTFAAPAGECDMACNGDSSQTCGGRGRLNLFVSDELQSLEPCGYEPPVSSSSVVPPTSTSTSSVQTTSPPITSTTTQPPITTTSSSACVSTTVVPPTCEYKCGKWCSSPLPDWQDAKTCKGAWSHCTLQVASCFKHAGWPDVLNCFDFGEWCADVSKYCDTKPSGGCRKSDFWGKKPPRGGAQPPKTITVTTTCAPATSTKPATSSTTKIPVPTPTNICQQPTSWLHGYGPGKPVGGIEMPVVTCNDLAEDWPNYPFKQYNDIESRKCVKYQRHQCPNACADACKEQYDDCVDVYAQGCKLKPKRRAEEQSYFEFAGSIEKRTFKWQDSWGVAIVKCKAQYADCLWTNKGVTGSGKCPKYGGW